MLTPLSASARAMRLARPGRLSPSTSRVGAPPGARPALRGRAARPAARRPGRPRSPPRPSRRAAGSPSRSAGPPRRRPAGSSRSASAPGRCSTRVRQSVSLRMLTAMDGASVTLRPGPPRFSARPRPSASRGHDPRLEPLVAAREDVEAVPVARPRRRCSTARGRAAFTRRRAERQNTSAMRDAPPPPRAPCVSTRAWARATEAAMAKVSLAMSTRRNRNACLFCSFAW